jgi:hypothetical protein
MQQTPKTQFPGQIHIPLTRLAETSLPEVVPPTRPRAENEET